MASWALDSVRVLIHTVEQIKESPGIFLIILEWFWAEPPPACVLPRLHSSFLSDCFFNIH